MKQVLLLILLLCCTLTGKASTEIVLESDSLIKAVSYTHLIQSTIFLTDSRQHRHPEQLTQQMIIQCISTGFQLIINIPVSYTHLFYIQGILYLLQRIFR